MAAVNLCVLTLSLNVYYYMYAVTCLEGDVRLNPVTSGGDILDYYANPHLFTEDSSNKSKQANKLAKQYVTKRPIVTSWKLTAFT